MTFSYKQDYLFYTIAAECMAGIDLKIEDTFEINVKTIPDLKDYKNALSIMVPCQTPGYSH